MLTICLLGAYNSVLIMIQYINLLKKKKCHSNFKINDSVIYKYLQTLLKITNCVFLSSSSFFFRKREEKDNNHGLSFEDNTFEFVHINMLARIKFKYNNRIK